MTENQRVKIFKKANTDHQSAEEELNLFVSSSNVDAIVFQ